MGEQLKQQVAFDVATEKDDRNIYHVDKYVSGAEDETGVYATRKLTEEQLKQVIGSLFNLIYTSDPALDTFSASISRTGTIAVINPLGYLKGEVKLSDGLIYCSKENGEAKMWLLTSSNDPNDSPINLRSRRRGTGASALPVFN